MIELHLLLDTAAALSATGVDLASRSGSSSDNSFYLLLLGPAAGIGFYTMTYLRYRNTDKRFEYEHKTSSDVLEPRGFDQKIDEVRGTQRRRIDGDNSTKPRERLGQGTSVVHE